MKTVGLILISFLIAGIVVQIINALFDVGLNNGSISGEADTLGWAGLVLLALIAGLLLLVIFVLQKKLRKPSIDTDREFTEFHDLTVKQVLSKAEVFDSSAIERLQQWERLN